MIRAREVRLIDPDGEQLGILTADEAREKAEEFGLDLVEVAPKAQPPVCKIMDYGKFKYQLSKKQKKATDNVSLKTLRMRPKTDAHDLNTKLDRATRFLEKGNQVKFVMQMRGRERQFSDRWVEHLEDIIDELREKLDREIKVVNAPESQGWQITAVIEPA
jgi:translation initiation factor IF-3